MAEENRIDRNILDGLLQSYLHHRPTIDTLRATLPPNPSVDRRIVRDQVIFTWIKGVGWRSAMEIVLARSGRIRETPTTESPC